MSHTISITEEQRQLILLALAMLALQRPGFDYALSETAKLFDNRTAGVVSVQASEACDAIYAAVIADHAAQAPEWCQLHSGLALQAAEGRLL